MSSIFVTYTAVSVINDLGTMIFFFKSGALETTVSTCVLFSIFNEFSSLC